MPNAQILASLTTFRQFGQRPALLDQVSEAISYEVLADHVDAFAARIGPERRLILLEPAQSFHSIVAYLASLKTRMPILLAPEGRGGADSALARQYKPGIVIGPDAEPERLDHDPNREVPLHPDLAVLLTTSGSTGGSKLVRLSLSNIEANARSIAEYLGLQETDRAALSLPLYYSYGLSILNSHLIVGAAVCLPNVPITSPQFLQWLDEAGCTNLSGVPYSYEIYERLGLRNQALKSLRLMTAAGGRLPPDTVRRYDRYLREKSGEFFVMYGQTEATARIAYLPPKAAEHHADCIGIAIPGGELSLIDEQGHAVKGVGVSGELVYGGPNVMMGYAESVEDLARGSEVGRLHTGDLAERTEQGFFRIVGRKSRFSKLSGFRVSHDDIEQQLVKKGHRAAVTGDDKNIIIAVEALDETQPLIEFICSFTLVTPAQIAFVHYEELPRLPTGKTDYGGIRDKAKRQLEADTYQKPAVSDSVLAVYQHAFWPQPVKPDESFVSLGGDSLTYVGLSLSLERLIGRLPADWENIPIDKLQAMIGDTRGWASVDPNIYVRAMAITMVLIHHLTNTGVRGGAFVLMALVGYSLARFQSPMLFAGRIREVGRHLGYNLLWYFIVLGVWMACMLQFRWPDLLLLGNTLADPTPQIAYNSYWFVEAYAQIVGFAMLAAMFPPLRRWVSSHPLITGQIAVIGSFFLVFLGRQVWYKPWHASYYHDIMPVTEVAIWAAIGWCLFFAKSIPQRVGTLLLALALLLIMDYLVYDIINYKAFAYTGIFALVMWRVRLPMPEPLSRLVNYAAANAYTLYLLHLLPVVLMQTYFDHHLSRHDPLGNIAGLALGFGFPIAVITMVRLLGRMLRGKATALPPQAS